MKPQLTLMKAQSSIALAVALAMPILWGCQRRSQSQGAAKVQVRQQDKPSASQICGRTLQISACRQACADADGHACASLGFLYDLGKGVAADAPEAVRYFRKGCGLDAAEACMGLGANYAHGRGVRQDYAQAARYWRKGCTLGGRGACADLAGLYATGLGVSRDEAMAKKLFDLSCKGNDSTDCRKLRQLERKNNSAEKRN